MTDYVLVGGGAFARELHDWFTPGFRATGDRFIGYLDDGDSPMRGTGHDLPQLGTIEGYTAVAGHNLVMAVSAPAAKQLLVAKLGASCFARLIHPTAWVSASARIGQGAIIALNTDISANATVGDFATVNGYSSVGHDACLGDFATLSGYVDLTGYADIGRATFVGSGACILPKVKLGASCTIGAGSVVVRSVGDGVTVYAAPARRL
ncbi:MAG: acetyltransferase [Janthinobacterium lividum]